MGTFTWSTGIGLFALGMAVLVIGGLIIWKVINYKPKEDRYGK